MREYKFISHTGFVDDGYYTSIMESNGRGSIYIYQSKDDARTAIAHSFHVDESERKHGLGLSFVAPFNDFIKNNNIHRVIIWTKKNSRLLKWYSKMGFVVTADKDSDEVFMEKFYNRVGA